MRWKKQLALIATDRSPLPRSGCLASPASRTDDEDRRPGEHADAGDHAGGDHVEHRGQLDLGVVVRTADDLGPDLGVALPGPDALTPTVRSDLRDPPQRDIARRSNWVRRSIVASAYSASISARTLTRS
jgi:hypothetical protein